MTVYELIKKLAEYGPFDEVVIDGHMNTGVDKLEIDKDSCDYNAYGDIEYLECKINRDMETCDVGYRESQETVYIVAKY